MLKSNPNLEPLRSKTRLAKLEPLRSKTDTPTSCYPDHAVHEDENVAIADAVMESQRWRPINAISSATPRGAPTDHAPPRNDPQCSHAKCLDAWKDVRQYLHSIKNTLQDIQSTMRVTTPDRSPTARTRRYSTTSDSSTGTQRTAPSANRATNDVCWYHEKHGVRATKCRSPCSFKAKPNQP